MPPDGRTAINFSRGEAPLFRAEVPEARPGAPAFPALSFAAPVALPPPVARAGFPAGASLPVALLFPAPFRAAMLRLDLAVAALPAAFLPAFRAAAVLAGFAFRGAGFFFFRGVGI